MIASYESDRELIKMGELPGDSTTIPGKGKQQSCEKNSLCLPGAIERREPGISRQHPMTQND
jgi:hypothetical protein